MSWQDNAACTGRDDVDWFPQPGTDAARRANLAAARAICDTCPVKAQCYAEAMADPFTAGIWAGTTEGQRRRSPQKHLRRPLVARCGTDAGYYRHLRYTFTEPCQACREAHAMTHRLRRMRLEVVR